MRIDVAVFEGDTFIQWARDRPARILPGGYLGVVFNGVVRPVYRHACDDGLSIDIDDDGCDPHECSFAYAELPPCIDDEEDDDEAEEIDWYLETNAYGHYVVFDGDKDTLNDVLGRLASHGIEVIRHAPSHRPADDGYQYDWFIRLDFDGSREEVESAVAEAMSASQSEMSPAVDPEDIHEVIRKAVSDQDTKSLRILLAAISRQSLVELAKVNEQLAEVTASAGDLQVRYAELERASALAKASYQASISGLESQNLALRKRLENGDDDVSNVAALEAQIANLQSVLTDQENLFRECERLENAVSDRDAALRAANQKNQSLAAENQSLAAENHRLGNVRSSDKLFRLASAGLKLFTNIDLHGDAADTIIRSFHNPAPLFGILQRLNGGENVPANAIGTAARGWFEVTTHISTGRSDMGRLYYKHRDGRLFVVVHCKKDDNEQQRFFNNLSNPDFMQDLGFD